MHGLSGSNVRGLEGRPEGSAYDEKPLRPREFFWDSIVLYVVSAIIGLTAIDVITEFIRGSAVDCFLPNPNETDITQVQSYINNFCSGSLPTTEYFPAFIVVHGILILVPHYLWLNHFGGTLDFFFQLAFALERQRDVKTGDYPEKNFRIVEQLHSAFTAFQQNSMFRAYFGKLVLQLLFSLASFVLAIFFFTDFDETFPCPQNSKDTSNRNWPLPNEQVLCVFTALRLLAWIRIADIVLLALVLVGLCWALIWAYSTHPTELGYKYVAAFSFQGGLVSRYYVSRLPVPRCCKGFCTYFHKFFTTLPWFSPSGFRIGNDLDFMIMKLFRTDGGLGYVLKQMQIQIEVKDLNNDERQRLALHLREQTDMHIGEPSEKQFVQAELKWKIEKPKRGATEWVRDGVYNTDEWKPITEGILEVPDSFRGAVLGFAALAPKNSGALCVSFGSPSVGLSHTLGRVFNRVGSVNFSPFYRNPDNDSKIRVDNESSGIVKVVCSDDVLTGAGYRTFRKSVMEIWKMRRAELKTNFIVIEPISKELHKTTVDVLLEEIEFFIAEDAVLLSVLPLKIAGKKVTKDDFKPYTPPRKRFVDLDRKATVNKAMNELPWPPASRSADDRKSSQCTSGSGGDSTNSDNLVPKNISDLTVVVGDSHSKFRFSLSKYSKLQASPKCDPAQRSQPAQSVPQTSPSIVQQNTAGGPTGKGGTPPNSTGTKNVSNQRPEHQAYTVEDAST